MIDGHGNEIPASSDFKKRVYLSNEIYVDHFTSDDGSSYFRIVDTRYPVLFPVLLTSSEMERLQEAFK